MKQILKNPNALKLILSNCITRYGDAVESIVFSWLVYEITGSLSIMGIVFVINFIPNIVFSPFAGVFADRKNRKKIVVISDIARGINALAVAALIMTGTVNVTLIIIFSIVNSTFESFASPARAALAVDVIDKDEYLTFSGLNTSASSFADLAGLASAGILVLLGGNGLAILIDGLTFILSAIGILIVAYNFIPKELNDNSAKSYFTDIGKGVKYVVSMPILIITIISSALLNFFFTPLNVLLPAYVDKILTLGVNGLSIIHTSLIVGIMLGGIIVAKLNHKVKLSRISIFGFFTMAATYIMFALAPSLNLPIYANIIVMIITSAIFGAAVPIVGSPIRSYIFKVIPNEKRGITSSILSMFSLISIPLGGALISIMGNSISIPIYFLIASLGVVGLSVFLSLNKTFKEC